MLNETLSDHERSLREVALWAQNKLIDEKVEEFLEVSRLVCTVDSRLLRLQNIVSKFAPLERVDAKDETREPTSSSQRLCAPSSVPKNLIGRDGGRFRASAT